MESPPLHPSHSAFSFQPAHTTSHLSSFPSLSPLPSPTDTGLLSSGESSLSWPMTLPPTQPRRGHSLPEWITADLPGESRQPLSSSLFSPLSSEPTWTSVTASSFSTALSHSSSSSVPAVRADVLFSASTSPSSAFQLLRMTSSSSAASSPDSSSPSSSSSPSASASANSASHFPSAHPPRRRYQRLTGLSHEQRMERRRQSHRELDAVRRQREALAIARLAELTATQHSARTPTHQRTDLHIAVSGGSTKQEEEMEVDVGMESDEKGKRHRTAVLENSVEKLEELQHLVRHLTATCQQQSHDIAALRLQLHSANLPPLPPTAATQLLQAVPLLSASNIRRVVAEFGATSLYSALFASPSVGLLLVDVASGVVLDVNERLLSGGQCTREDVVGRLVAPTYHAITSYSDWDSQPTIDPASRMHVRGQPAMMYSQYGVTKESVLSLYRGQVDQIFVQWRAQLGDGLAYELPLSSFVASRDEAAGGMPRTVVVSLSLSEAKRI